MSRLRTASVQWDMKRVNSLDELFERVAWFVETAVADYEADLVLFPEYFTLPLLSSEGLLPARKGLRRLAERAEEVLPRLAELAREHKVWIFGGSMPVLRGESIWNICPVYGPGGESFEQPKLHITPWERRAWRVEGGSELPVIDIGKAKVGVQICYDVEFPEPTRRLAEQGMEVLLVPYCTDDRRGHLRVTRCAMARAVENQIDVVTAGCIGNLAGVAAANIHYAESGAFTPVDVSFPWDGIAAKAEPCMEQLLIAELDLEVLRASRGEGTVTPLKDRRTDLFG